MRRLLATVLAGLAVLAVALVIAVARRPVATGHPAAAAIVLVREPNGTLVAVPVTTHAVTQSSGSASAGPGFAISPRGQAVATAPATTGHATTRSS
jgi:hypothetical protein